LAFLEHLLNFLYWRAVFLAAAVIYGGTLRACLSGLYAYRRVLLSPLARTNRGCTLLTSTLRRCFDL